MDKTLAADPLFLGLTRPPVVGGVPQSFFVLNMMLSMMAFLMLNAFWPLLIGGPLLHGVAYLICLKDIRTFDLWLAKAKFLRCLNRRYWGANSYDPFQ